MAFLRILTNEGIRKFREFLREVRIHPSTPIPNLNDERFSTSYQPKINILDRLPFQTKHEMGEYLYQKFDENTSDFNCFIQQKGLWTWLAYHWFDDLTKSRERILKRDEYYIATTPENYTRYYLHLVLTPFLMIYKLESDSIIFNYNEIYRSNDFAERVAPNQFLISHKNIIKAIRLLYFDETKIRHKKGALDQNKKGNIRRFIKVIQQYELTYDIYSMTPDEIIELLPDEFEEWKTSI